MQRGDFDGRSAGLEVGASELPSVTEPALGWGHLWGEREDFIQRVEFGEKVVQGIEANVEALGTAASRGTRIVAVNFTDHVLVRTL